MSNPELQISVETGHELYAEGADYMKLRVINIIKAELERHRKGSSGYATVDLLLTRVQELKNVT